MNKELVKVKALQLIVVKYPYCHCLRVLRCKKQLYSQDSLSHQKTEMIENLNKEFSLLVQGIHHHLVAHLEVHHQDGLVLECLKGLKVAEVCLVVLHQALAQDSQVAHHISSEDHHRKVKSHLRENIALNLEG